MRSQEKEKPLRSEKYKAYIRTLDCCSCGWPSDLGYIECHHVVTSGMATKGTDALCVPLCGFYARGCHNKADKGPENVEKYQEIAKSLFQVWSVKNGKKKSESV